MLAFAAVAPAAYTPRSARRCSAFIPSPVPTPSRSRAALRTPAPAAPFRLVSASASASPSAPSPVPASLSDTLDQASASLSAALSAGRSRLIVEIDTAQGDQTYTILKQTTTLLRPLASALSALLPVTVVFPDSGIAALSARDWADAEFAVTSIDSLALSPPSTRTAFIIVAPGAREVPTLVSFTNAASPNIAPIGAPDPCPVILINPDVVDMGATGLGYTARVLRNEFLSTFETAYFLKVYQWGVLTRRYPELWAMWEDKDEKAANREERFALVKTFKDKPTYDDFEEAFADTDGKGAKSTGGFMAGMSRFLNTLMKG